jgi:hypothetical protein
MHGAVLHTGCPIPAKHFRWNVPMSFEVPFPMLRFQSCEADAFLHWG